MRRPTEANELIIYHQLSIYIVRRCRIWAARHDAVFEAILYAHQKAFFTQEGTLLHRFVFSNVFRCFHPCKIVHSRPEFSQRYRGDALVLCVEYHQSKHPLHRRTPFDPENKRLFPIQAQAVLSPFLPSSQSQRLGAGCGVFVDRLT